MIEHPFHVMIVVQQPIFRQGILAILKQIAGCEVIGGQPHTTSEAIALAHEQEPEVALLDTLCDSLDALELARHMRTSSPKTAIMMLSAWEGEEWLFQAVKGGVAAYCTRNITPDELIEAIQKVSQGEYVLNDEVLSQPHLVNRVLQSFRELSAGAEEGVRPLASCPLSVREVEILAAHCQREYQQGDRPCASDQRSDRQKPYQLDLTQVGGQRSHGCGGVWDQATMDHLGKWNTRARKKASEPRMMDFLLGFTFVSLRWKDQPFVPNDL